MSFQHFESIFHCDKPITSIAVVTVGVKFSFCYFPICNYSLPPDWFSHLWSEPLYAEHNNIELDETWILKLLFILLGPIATQHAYPHLFNGLMCCSRLRLEHRSVVRKWVTLVPNTVLPAVFSISVAASIPLRLQPGALFWWKCWVLMLLLGHSKHPCNCAYVNITLLYGNFWFKINK